MKLNKRAYSELIQEDLNWLKMAPECIERMHIEDVLKWSISMLFPTINDLTEAIRTGRPAYPGMWRDIQAGMDALSSDDAVWLSDAEDCSHK